MLDERLAADRILLLRDHLGGGDLHLVVHVLQEGKYSRCNFRRLVGLQGVQQEHFFLRHAAVLAAHLARDLDEEFHHLRLGQEIGERAQRPGDLVAPEDETLHRRQRGLAGLDDERHDARLLFVVGDPRIDADGVAHQQRVDRLLGLELAQLFDGALPVLRRAELLHRLLLQPGQLGPEADHVENSHGAFYSTRSLRRSDL